MKVIAKKNRELNLINAQNTQNENRAETITLVVPEEYEDYNKKIVFVTPNETVWDVITNNEYKITNAITKYDEVEFYIWLTKGNVDFRTKTRPLKFYHNEDASDEITQEQINGVNTIVNLLEEEINKVENLNLEAEKIGTVTALTITKKDGTTQEVEILDGYTPQKGTDYFTQEDIEEIENDLKTDLEENVLVDYSLITETGSKIDLSINTTNYKLTAILKDKNNNIICTSNEIDLPLETMVVSASYDNTTKEIILTLQNGTTVEFSVADLASGLVSESQLQTILANYYTQTEINNLLANKVDKVQGKGLSTEDYTTAEKTKLSGIEAEANKTIVDDELDNESENPVQNKVINTEIENLQAENERLRNTNPTTTGTGQNITLNKTAELEFKKPPLPMGNSEQVQYSGKQLIPFTNQDFTLNGVRHYVQNGALYLNGTTTTETNQRNELYKTNFSMTLPAGTYYFKRGTSNIPMYIIKYDDNTNIVTNEGQFTLEETTQVYFGIYLYQRTLNNEKIDCQLELGNSATSYEPYTFGQAPNPNFEVPITNVTGDVEVVVGNKNLFAYNNIIQDAYYEINLTTNVLSLRSYSNAFCEKIIAKEEESFTFNINNNYSSSVNLYIFAVDKDMIRTDFYYWGDSVTAGNSRQRTFTVPKNTKYLLISILGFPSELNIEDYLEIQFEKGNTKTDFIIGKSQTFTFPLGNEKLMLGDYLADDGIHHVRGQDIFDGSEDEVWEKIYGSIENGIALYSVNKNHKQVDGLSDKFVMRNSLSIWYNGEGVTTKWRNDKIGFMINGERINNDYSISAIKNLMNNNPVTVECELEEEVIVPYTSAQQTVYNAIKQALSYEGQTNISSNQNAIFNVEAYLDTKVILSEKVDKVTGKGLSTNDFTNTYKNSVDSNTSARHTHTNKTVLDGIVSSDITNWNGKQNETDNSLNTTNKTITGAINEVYSIARGANQAVSYSNYQAMITAFNSLANDVYNVGQNVMIVTLQVPDLWISGIESTSQSYTYTSDSDFTNALATNGYVQVGYYKLSALETQKVDLTNYEQNTNKTTTISSSSTNAQYPSAKAVYDYIQSLDGDEVSY